MHKNYVANSGFFFTIGKKTETKKLRILKKLRVIPAKKLRLSEALCNVPGPKNWDYRRPYLVSSAQKNSEYEKNSKLSTKNSACRRVEPTRSSKNLVKKKAWFTCHFTTLGRAILMLLFACRGANEVDMWTPRVGENNWQHLFGLRI